MDPAFEYHHIALDLAVNPLGFYLGSALECRFDAALNIASVDPGTKGELIVDAQHAGQFAHGPFRGFFLVLPVHLAFQGDPPMLHDDFDVAFGHVGTPIDDFQRATGNGVICRAGAFLGADLNFFGDRAYAFEAFDRALCIDFLGIGGNVTGEGHHTIVHGHANVRSIDFRLEFQFIKDGITQTQVVHDEVLCEGRETGRTVSARSVFSTPERGSVIELYQQWGNRSVVSECQSDERVCRGVLFIKGHPLFFAGGTRARPQPPTNAPPPPSPPSPTP